MVSDWQKEGNFFSPPVSTELIVSYEPYLTMLHLQTMDLCS